MQVGDLVKCKYSNELFVIISECDDGGYHDVCGLATGKTWLMPQEHLEVLA